MSSDNAESGMLAPAPLGPVAAGERIVTLDVLRGLALFGVLIANLTFDFGGLGFLPWEALRAMADELSLDSLALYFNWIFVSGKARTTFSFLFGLGFAVLMLKAQQCGRPIVPFYARRLAVLLVIGLLHTLLFFGDIVASYAALGFLLLLFRRSSNRTLLVWAALLTLILPVARASVPILMDVLRPDLSLAVTGTDAEAQDEAILADLASGEASRIFAANLEAVRLWWTPPLNTLLVELETLGLFLIGLYIGRLRVFEDPAAYRPSLRRLVFWGLPIALVLSAGGLWRSSATTSPSWARLRCRLTSGCSPSSRCSWRPAMSPGPPCSWSAPTGASGSGGSRPPGAWP